LSCPEAAELFLKMPKSALTEMTEWEARQLDNDIPYESMYSDESLLKIIKMRDDLMEKASSSSDPVSLFGGIFSLSEYIKRNSDEASDFEAIFADEALAYRFEGSPLPEETVRVILGLVGELEYASSEFSKELGAMAKKVLALPHGAVEEVLRTDGELAGKAVIYFLHRYLAVGLATGEVGRMMGLAVSLATLFLIYVNQFTEKAGAIADFSRNIEYSEYNVELIASLRENEWE
jgi:hypothetical protein